VLTLLAEIAVIFFAVPDIQSVCSAAPCTRHFRRNELIIKDELLKQIVAKWIVHVLSPFNLDLAEGISCMTCCQAPKKLNEATCVVLAQHQANNSGKALSNASRLLDFFIPCTLCLETCFAIGRRKNGSQSGMFYPTWTISYQSKESTLDHDGLGRVCWTQGGGLKIVQFWKSRRFMTTFIHTADWQLGKSFARVEEFSKRARLQQERISVLHRIAEHVTAYDAAFVLVAGDLFDSTTVTRSVVSEACSAIGRMGVPVYVIPGNHDHGGPGGIWEQTFFNQERKQLAQNLTVLLSAEPIATEHALLFPCPLLRRHESTDTTAWLRKIEPDELEQFGSKPRIVVAHGSIQGFGSIDEDDDSGSNSVNQIDLSRIPSGVFDYVALGDWHGTKQVADNAWYSGTPEQDRFPKGDSNRPGNILVVQSARGVPPVVSEVKTAKFGWHNETFRFSEDSSVELFQQNIAQVIENRVGEDLLRLEFSGSLGLKALGQLEAIQESLKSRLLRLKLSGGVRTAPTAAEIDSLTMRGDDPVIAAVAKALLLSAQGDSEEAQIARLALRELYTACHSA